MPSFGPEATVGLEEESTTVIAETIRAAYGSVFGHVPDSVEVVGDRSVVVAVLRGVFDREERSLVAAGGFREVRRFRWTHREKMAPMICAGVEDALGAEVGQMIPEVIEEDVVTITFLLEQPD